MYLSDNENVGSDNHLGLRISQSESILTDMTHVISPMSHHSFHAKSPISAGINQHVTVRAKKNSHLFTHQSALIMHQNVVRSHIVLKYIIFLYWLPSSNANNLISSHMYFIKLWKCVNLFHWQGLQPMVQSIMFTIIQMVVLQSRYGQNWAIFDSHVIYYYFYFGKLNKVFTASSTELINQIINLLVCS